MQPQEQETTLRELHRSLDERWRPEDVALRVVALLEPSGTERDVLEQAAEVARQNVEFTMSRDFERPGDMSRQLEVAEGLFGRKISFAPDDLPRIEEWILEAERTIGKSFGRNDFKEDRLPRQERIRAGIDLSRRQYNKRFRLAARLENKARKLARERFKRSLTLASKSRLAAGISWQDFSSDLNSACFIAYYVARCNLRSLFTNTSQPRPYDEICDMLMRRCQREPQRANWWAVAHVLPGAEVVARLDDEQKGVLLGDYYHWMNETAQFLRQLWEANTFSDDMVVRKGNDSTTWNVAAGAWNRLREGWFSLLYALGMLDAVQRMCPGKVLRLIAADVAFWHRLSGGGLHEDTQVWKELPRPWEVVSGALLCPRSLVDAVCARHGLDPVKSGWSAPKPAGVVERFAPTPELVHGVVVASPALALVLRKAGVFSGKVSTSSVAASTVADIRSRHWNRQNQRRKDLQKSNDDPTAV